ncbi:hypothetical protein KPG71_18870 [Roseovarius sp. PS-C2]|uniref:hypothetical protein n=1 Tax=Roseovarius sp. PS-C2 TaxID=2820814 RepID=UPI001C0CFA33|nr:hypothetical protein [Roseovarius sp. PS-C2]MBU3262089.1 hypothetical protein [Roseovarius sp. PS-C2]
MADLTADKVLQALSRLGQKVAKAAKVQERHRADTSPDIPGVIIAGTVHMTEPDEAERIAEARIKELTEGVPASIGRVIGFEDVITAQDARALQFRQPHQAAFLRGGVPRSGSFGIGAALQAGFRRLSSWLRRLLRKGEEQ